MKGKTSMHPTRGIGECRIIIILIRVLHIFSDSLSFSCLFFRYDLANSNVNDPHLETLPEQSRPDVVIVKKVYHIKFRNQISPNVTPLY